MRVWWRRVPDASRTSGAPERRRSVPSKHGQRGASAISVRKWIGEWCVSFGRHDTQRWATEDAAQVHVPTDVPG